MAKDPVHDFLMSEHPIFTVRKPEWITNERRFAGGPEVVDELRRFDSEEGSGSLATGDIEGEKARQLAIEARLAAGASVTHYLARQQEAIYTNFPESFAGLLVGHLMRAAPVADQALNFGTLGKVIRPKEQTDPDRAELLYYNTDGVGNNGMQWNNYWTGIGKWAAATGHRWNMVEAPAKRPARYADVLNGLRPYLNSYSPLDVPNWHEENGKMLLAALKFWYRRPRIVNGAYEGNALLEGRRLFVMKGFEDFGPLYAGGGWWDFDQDGGLLDGRSGNWDQTKGEIPMWAHYYERHPKRMSRSAIFEMGQAAIAYMNQDSAASFDAWDAASSTLFVLGCDRAGFNLLIEKLKESRIVPVLMNEALKTVPQIYDGSMGAVTAEVFLKRLTTIRETVREIASLEVSGGPDASGLAKQMGFLDAKSPRLALMASEMENSQNTAIHFFELRSGKPDGSLVDPVGSVKWQRDFDLKPILDSINEFFEMQARAGVSSATLTTRGLLAGDEEAGLITDGDDRKNIEAEYMTALQAKAARDAQDTSLLGDFLPGGTRRPEPAPEPAAA